MVTAIFTTNSTAGAAIMDDRESNRGCPLCARVVVDPQGEQGAFLYDARGRYWCLACAGEALAQITRKNEARLTAHYRWNLDDGPFEARSRNDQPTQRELRDLRTQIKQIDLRVPPTPTPCLQQPDNCKAADCPEHGIFAP